MWIENLLYTFRFQIFWLDKIITIWQQLKFIKALLLLVNMLFSRGFSHIGIHGNTVVDQEAKHVLDAPKSNCSIPYSDIKPFILKYILKRSRIVHHFRHVGRKIFHGLLKITSTDIVIFFCCVFQQNRTL